MSPPKRIDGWAKGSLLLALSIAVGGLLVHLHTPYKFLGGLLLAFGEAALVGGLADWFAVRALFVHPFGIPFPHSALIPRNRRRIVAELRELVENEWLPKPLLVARIDEYDFVGDALLPLLSSHRGELREIIRTIARNVLSDVSASRVAGFLARGTAQALERDKITPFLAQLARRAREEAWLVPLVVLLLKRLEEWAASRESHDIIYRHLEQAADSYRGQGWFKNFTYQIAEVFGGLDLEAATQLLQSELSRFATAQQTDESQLQRVIHEGLANIEWRLLEDPAFLRGLRTFLVETSDSGALPTLLDPIISSVKAQGLRELETPESPFLQWVLKQLDAWLDKVAEDDRTRIEVNTWCRQLAGVLVEKHHSLIGSLVEEQLNRLSDHNLTALIENKVGEDLNWIRLNGTFVGGLVGVALYLLFAALGLVVAH